MSLQASVSGVLDGMILGHPHSPEQRTFCEGFVRRAAEILTREQINALAEQYADFVWLLTEAANAMDGDAEAEPSLPCNDDEAESVSPMWGGNAA